MQNLFQDKHFYSRLFTLSTPIIIQNLIAFSLGAVDMIMIGQLGDQPVAAVGLADQIFFLLILMHFGVASGAAIFSAQYWGKQDLAGIHKVLGLSLLLSVLGSVVFAVIAITIPEWALGIYTSDPVVIELGSDYLRIVGWSYVSTAVSVSYIFILRSIEAVKLPMVVGAIALILNTAMNYILIFGHLGFPALGVEGAAIATAIARTLEPLILIGVIYTSRSPLAASIGQLLAFDWAYVVRFLKTAFPVILTEVTWSLGITTYSIIFARISTEAIAAVNIAITIERVAFVTFVGLSNACSIMVGNRIGANEIDKAIMYAKRYLLISILTAIPIGLIMVLSGNLILSVYKISELVSTYANFTLIIMGLALPIKASAMMLFIGVLRSGGDTQFSFFVDSGFIWLVGVPLALFAAFVLGWPVYWVYLMVIFEEILKSIVAFRRFISGRWIHNLADHEQSQATA